MTAGVLLPPRTRKLLLVAHVIVSVGWVGAAVAYLSLDLTVASTGDPLTLRGAYLSMDVIARRAIAPLAVTSLLSGVAISVVTKWGLFRHYWVLISLVLTTIATAVLLVEVQVIRGLAAVAADPATSVEELRGLPTTLPHSIGGIIVLLVVLVLNMYKPAGVTPYGWRRSRRTLVDRAQPPAQR